jgi:ribosomal protein L31
MRQGLHPLMRKMRVVLRNGASYEIETILHRTAPQMCPEDPTTHSTWTGGKKGISLSDARLQRVMKRFEGFVSTTPTAAADTGPQDNFEPPKKKKSPKKR